MRDKSTATAEAVHTKKNPSAEPHALCLDETEPLSLSDVFVSRQPIYTDRLNVFAYDVLFHSDENNPNEPLKGYQTASQLIVNALLEIGLESIVENKRALITLSSGPLLLDYALALPADQVIISVKGHTPLDGILLEHLRDLSEHGYLISADYFAAQAYLDVLPKIACMISLDVSVFDPIRLKRYMAGLRHADIALLATNVNTHDAFTLCKELGFTYFQGEFLCQPDVLRGRRSATNRLTLLQLLARLQDPDIEFSEVEALISRDASLSYKVLQVVNSAFFGLPRKIDAIRQAILLLGLKAIQTWVSLIMLTGIDDKPYELLTTAMVRARMCEILAQTMGHNRKETFFLVGLFSILDALLDTPMPEVLASLPLADDVTQAILSHEGLLGTALHCVIAYEQGKWDDVACPGLERGAIVQAYLDATAWAASMRKTLRRS